MAVNCFIMSRYVDNLARFLETQTYRANNLPSPFSIYMYGTFMSCAKPEFEVYFLHALYTVA